MPRYYGSKGKIGSRVAAAILQIVANSNKEYKAYIEPFCGALGILKHTSFYFKKCYAYDINKDIILLWLAIKDGSFKNPHMTRELYYKIKTWKEPSALRAYAGFFCSFMGVWQSSYIEEPEEQRYKGTIKYHHVIQNVKFKAASYLSLESRVKTGSYVIYCDPPYNGTNCTFGPRSSSKSLSSSKTSETTVPSRLDYKKEPFDTNLFWTTMARWRSYGNLVIVSEFKAPKGWKCVWSYKRAKNMNNSKTRSLDCTKEYYEEKLFV